MDKFTAQAVATIVDDNVSGAVEIADKSAEVLYRLMRSDQSTTITALEQNVLEVGGALIKAHPTMAPLVNLINALLWAVTSADELGQARARAVETVHEFKRRLHVHEAAIAETALRLIPEEGQIVTNGRSTTVCAALRHAQRAGRRIKVVCAEGRPACEGRSLATELAAIGLHVTLVIDALAVMFAAQAQLVLVGADFLDAQGLVNKVGTYAMTLAAGASGVPVYALCGSEKFLPPGYHPPPQARWPGEQVWDNPAPGVRVENLYFDRTPLNALAGIVTEQGIQPSVGIEAWLAATRLHPALSDMPGRYWL